MFSIEINVTKDKKITVSEYDKNAVTAYLQQLFNFHITNKGAYKLVKENRMLANFYLDENNLSKYDISYIKIIAENYLADKVVKDIQSKADLSEKVLLSYYIENKDKFKKEDKIKPIIFWFKDPDDAINFYMQMKTKDLSYMKARSKNFKVFKIEDVDYKPITFFKKEIRNLISPEKKGKLLYPMVLSSQVANVMYIEDYQKAVGNKPFKNIKEEIKKILLKKSFNDFRKKLIQQYRKVEK